jgi:hypothetical protein
MLAGVTAAEEMGVIAAATLAATRVRLALLLEQQAV